MYRIVALTLLVATAAAHSNLGYPLPYSRIACKASESWCKGACPPMWKSTRGRYNSPDKPAATWRRGQRVEIVWHKNNHIGGFYRRSLVPVNHMMDRKWHQKAAFEWGCWSQGTFNCGRSARCGGDKKGKAYKNIMTVPSVFPDGDYVFSQAWYGGLHWQGKRPKYSDYYACSFVRIRGGKLTPSYKATFRPGKKKRNIPEGVCATGSTRLMQCGGDGCEKGPVFKTKPAEFQRSSGPTLQLRMFGNEAMKHVTITEKEPDAEAKKAVEEEKQDTKEDAKVAEEEEKALKESPALANEIAGDVVDDVPPTPSPAPMKPSPMRRAKSRSAMTLELRVGKNGVHHYYWRGAKSKNDRSGCTTPPPRPTGTWGRTYSKVWWKQRNMMVKRRVYCAQCGC